MDSSESWEPATVILKRSSYQIKTNNVEAVVISEKYSKELLVKKTPLTLSLSFLSISCSESKQKLFFFMFHQNKIEDKSTMWILNTVCSDKL